VYKVDRLTRALADFAKMVELFDAHSVSFVAVTQQFNTRTSMGRWTSEGSPSSSKSLSASGLRGALVLSPSPRQTVLRAVAAGLFPIVAVDYFLVLSGMAFPLVSNLADEDRIRKHLVNARGAACSLTS
jgi:hypothetical protein